MEIILLEKIQKLGQIGDVVKVKSGYARNYLVPEGKAMYATSDNKKTFQEKKSNIEAENAKKKKESENLSKKFDNKEVILIRAASDAGQLYGSVTSKDISNALNKDGFEINKNQISLNKSIKYLTYEEIQIKLHPEVFVNVILNVARTLEEAEKQKKSKKAVISVNEKDDDNENLNKNSSSSTLEKKESTQKDEDVKDSSTLKTKESSKEDEEVKESSTTEEKESSQKDKDEKDLPVSENKEN